MNASWKVANELTIARQIHGRMVAAPDLQTFESAWADLLHRLERVWNKLSAHYKKSPRWGQLERSIHCAPAPRSFACLPHQCAWGRRTQCQRITNRHEATVQITAEPSGSTLVRLIEGADNLVRIEYTGGAPEVVFLPARMRLLPIVNRGRTYEVPNSHAGSLIDPTDVAEIAATAIRFYERAVNDADSHFGNA